MINRIDIVGSFLPPEKLTDTVRLYDSGLIGQDKLLETENEAIGQLVERLIEAGLREVTSGELRRRQWDKDFWFGLAGIRRERVDNGHIYQPLDLYTDLMRFTGPIGFNPGHPFFYDFSFLRKVAGGRANCRQTIPSPANLYLEILSMTGGNPELIYPADRNLLSDIAESYNLTIRNFYSLGCRHIQFDDTACGMLCDGCYTKRLLQGGIDIIALHEQIINLFNDAVSGLPADMEVSLFLSGGDTIVPEWEFLRFPDNIMPKVLSLVNASKFFLPFDTRNDYQLEVLRHIPDGKKVVLGLLDAHSPLTDDGNDIIDTIVKASAFIDPSLLSISPRTGFKLSSYQSRGLTYEDQWTKLARLGELLRYSKADHGMFPNGPTIKKY